MRKKPLANPRNLISLGVFLVILISASYTTFTRVDNGHVGIKYSPNGGVQKEALSQGIHFVGIDKITEYPIRTTVVKNKVAVSTKDGKKTEIDVSYSYHVDPKKAVDVYKQFNTDIKPIEDGWLASKLQKTARNEVAKYTVLEVSGSDSSKVQASLLNSFTASVEKEGFVIEDLSFGTPSIDDQTRKSIDDNIKAGQDTIKAELEAKTKQTNAEADAKAKITKAQAEADANKKINDSITDNTIKYKEAEARNKFGWYTIGDGKSVIVDGKDK